MTGPLFTARGGEVHFRGQRLPEMRAVALRQRLVTKALSLTTSEECASLYRSAARDLRAALAASRDQRRAVAPTTSRPEPIQ